RRPLSLLRRRDVVRAQRRGRNSSLRLAMVELAADAAADSLLAEFPATGQSRHNLGRWKSASLVERADRYRNNCGTRTRAAEHRAHLSGSRVSGLSRDLGAGRANPLSISLHAICLSGV